MPSSRSIRTLAVTLGLVLAGAGGLGAQIQNSAALAVPIGEQRTYQDIGETADEQRFVELINQLRVSKGLTPLAVHPVLVPIARQWADHLREQGTLSHTPDLSVGIDLAWTRLGENVGVGPIDQVQALFDAFVASPSHYANLVKEDYRYVGIGVVHDDDGRIWTAHRFMALAEVPPPTAAPAPMPETGPSTTTPSGAAPPSPTPAPAPPISSPSTVPPEPVPDPVRPLSPAFVERLSNELAEAGI